MKTKHLLLLMLCTWLCLACGKKRAGTAADWLKADDVHVAIDETFRPLMEAELEVFAARHPEAALYPQYVSENEAIRLLVSDSLRCCVATRKLSEKELRMVEANRLRARHTRIAYDAFALITHKANPDTAITLDEIRGIVSGKITRWEQLSRSTRKGELSLVFDNEGSSTVRYMTDSLNGGQPLKGNVFAQGSNEKVIELVKQDPDIIGVVGADWLKQKGDSALHSFRNLDFNVMLVSRFSGVQGMYFRPYQYYIATGEYPLVRDVYAITTDPRTKSQVKNFYFFLSGQVGQLVICNNSQMLPVMPVQVKSVANN